MGFSDRWLNQKTKPKKAFAIFAIPHVEASIANIANGFHESEIEMAAYPHLAPCPLRGGQWVYRGQACEGCEKRQGCPAWAVQTFTPRSDLPSGIKPRRSAK